MTNYLVLNAPRHPRDGTLDMRKYPFWHQIIDFMPFTDLQKMAMLSKHLNKEATLKHKVDKFEKSMLQQFSQSPNKSMINKQDLFVDDTQDEYTGDEDGEDYDEDDYQSGDEKQSLRNTTKRSSKSFRNTQRSQRRKTDSKIFNK